jgi:hypothetical protein
VHRTRLQLDLCRPWRRVRTGFRAGDGVRNPQGGVRVVPALHLEKTAAVGSRALAIDERLVADMIDAAKAVLAALRSTPAPKT